MLPDSLINYQTSTIGLFDFDQFWDNRLAIATEMPLHAKSENSTGKDGLG